MTQQGPSTPPEASTTPGPLRAPSTPLSRITGPADLRSMTPAELADLAQEIREFLVDQTSKRGGHLGPNLGVVELTIALHLVFDSPSRSDRVRHRSPGVRAQDHHRPGGPVRPAADPWRAVRLSQSCGITARLGRELARVDIAVLRRRDGEGVRAARGAAPDGGGRDRGRRADRRDGLGGAEQHRRGPGPAAGDRAERQRPLVRTDHRRDGRADWPRCGCGPATSGCSAG